MVNKAKSVAIENELEENNHNSRLYIVESVEKT